MPHFLKTSLSTHPQRREAGRPSNWDRYLSVLEVQRFPENQRRWNLVRAEAFVDFVKPARMTEVESEQVVAFFHRHSLEQSLSDWQYRQMVEAVQLLVIDLADNWACRSVDWDYWKEAGRVLAVDHPTMAQAEHPEALVSAVPRYQVSADQHEPLKALADSLRGVADLRKLPSKP